ncbi:hypothetical protein FQN60_000899 [Etheostoma spectabile]|uniref:Small ribosomal subunit protein mS31 n=1 Tax=Etheostoma spectabile TaxID=54343 RepID=A0A5J5D1L8_9PERO|nr:hypothetical protein FQN60_000899 [Etheostoma spectabile]
MTMYFVAGGDGCDGVPGRGVIKVRELGTLMMLGVRDPADPLSPLCETLTSSLRAVQLSSCNCPTPTDSAMAFMDSVVYTARNSSVSVYESCALPVKCNKAAAPVSRVANGGGVKALSTSSVRFCEKRNDVTPSNQDQKTNADKEADPTETPTLVTQKPEDDSNVINMVEQREEEPVLLKTDDGRTTKQQVDVKIEQVVATPQQGKADAAKSGKESLLDLLGAMRVEVTNKRKLKNLKVKPSYETAPKAKPAAMESTISMFQKATVEASSQSETLDPELVAAASAAASTLPDRSQAESELLRQLRQHEAVTEAQKKGDTNNLGVIIADMKVGKNPNRQSARPANQIRFDEDGRGYKHDRGITAELDGVRRRQIRHSSCFTQNSGFEMDNLCIITCSRGRDLTSSSPLLMEKMELNQQLPGQLYGTWTLLISCPCQPTKHPATGLRK